jgi:beta-glucosidase
LRLRLTIGVLVFLALDTRLMAAQSAMTHSEAVRRARALVAAMSLDEKIAQAHGFRDETHHRTVAGNARLGIPELHVTNGPAGVGPGGAGPQKPATAMPAPIALAATWDPEAARLYGRIVGEETRELGSNLLESPDINIARVPQAGRVFEGYGEDPFLTARIGAAHIEGIQSTGMIANVKHYVANNQETDRLTINEIIPERALREIYLPAFEAAVKEAHVASIMCAYPRINGLYNCENKPLLDGIIRSEWGFDGFITSDFGAVHSTVPSVLAGLDLELPTGIYLSDQLRAAVESGAVPMKVLDEMLVRRFAKMMEFGWFGPQPAAKPVPVSADGGIAREIADESMVLLKNEGGIIPLDAGRCKSVALIGTYAVQPMTGGGGSSHVVPLYKVAPVDGLRAALNAGVKIQVLDGSDVPAAVAAAKQADVAILMVGDDEGEEHDHGIDLTGDQNELIAAVVEANPRTVVVLKSGSAVIMPWVDRVPAILEAWYPGEEDGNAVADVLLGKVNPSGKLPLTFPRTVADTLAANKDQFPGDGVTVHYSEGLKVGYRAFQAGHLRPLFPFGFGLSYTSFRMDGLTVEAAKPGGQTTVTFTVTNTGKRAGDEVAQLYLTYPAIAEGNEPPRQLKAFQKVTLGAGETKTVQLTLNARSFSYWSERAHDWRLAHGTFTLEVGNSSADTPLAVKLAVP